MLIVKCFITSPLSPFKGGIWRHFNVNMAVACICHFFILNNQQELSVRPYLREKGFSSCPNSLFTNASN